MATSGPYANERGRFLSVVARLKDGVTVDRAAAELRTIHARLADEYELKERAGALARKLDVVGETARALTDLIDASRSLRLEIAIVALIVVEVLFTLYEFFKHLK